MTVRLDHLVVAASSLIEGEAWMAERLGVAAGGYGRHAAMGTHNALWRLDPVYLEVIAIDPEGVAPDRPRWFGLDDPRIAAALDAGPKLLTWAVAVDGDLEAVAARAPVKLDPPKDFARDDLTWQVALPGGRGLPLSGAWPLTICWTGGLHPAKRLPENGLALRRLTVAGGGTAAVVAALGAVEGPVEVAVTGEPFEITAEIETPDGLVRL